MKCLVVEDVALPPWRSEVFDDELGCVACQFAHEFPGECGDVFRVRVTALDREAPIRFFRTEQLDPEGTAFFCIETDEKGVPVPA